MVRSARLLAGLALLLGIAALLQIRGVNGPHEWRWEYRPRGLEPAAAGVAGLAAVVLVAFGAACGARAAGVSVVDGPAAAATPRRRRRVATVALVLALLVAGAAFTAGLVAAQPGGAGRVIASLVSRHSFGYLYDAALPEQPVELLDRASRERRSLHSRTHPPGALLAVRGLDAAMGRLPPTPWTSRWEQLAEEAWDAEVKRARPRRRAAPAVTLSPRTTLAVGLLLAGASVLVVVPLLGLARRWGVSPAGARLAAALWLLLPARSLFTPSLDQALPLGGLVAALLVAAGGRTRAALAGVLLAACCFASYGYLVLVPFVVGLALLRDGWLWLFGPAAVAGPVGAPAALGWSAAVRSPDALARAVGRHGVGRGLAVLAGFLLPWGVLALASDHAPWRALRDALAAHRLMAVVTRDYWTWLLGNPYDFTLLMGPPVVGLALAPLLGRGAPPMLRGAATLWWVLLLALLLLGSVRGEVGRIWLLFAPFACVFAGEALAAPPIGCGLRRAVLAVEGALALALAASMVFVS
jgi:hypothetical protein